MPCPDGRRCSHCSPRVTASHKRRAANLREREQRAALADVLAGRVQDHVGDYQYQPVTLTRGMW